MQNLCIKLFVFEAKQFLRSEYLYVRVSTTTIAVDIFCEITSTKFRKLFLWYVLVMKDNKLLNKKV